MGDTAVESHPVQKRRVLTKKKLLKCITTFSLACTVGYIHYRYVSLLFENDRNFSHLSEMEREMSLRTEMGFYYSYYKTIVQEQPFSMGISKLMYDRLVEYPNDVNAFNRFNIHPEVIIGAIYRYFEPVLNTSAYRQCHIVDRGEGLSPVESCVGLGEPIMFYLEAIWVFAGVLLAALFFQATALSGSVWGGLACVVQYMCNHAECSRAQWAPNQRENFAAPLLALQAAVVTRCLSNNRAPAARVQVSVFILNCLALLFWQFTQFIFLTQIAIFFVMEQLKIINVKTLCVLLHSHFCGLHMAVLLLQGNDMLKSSLYASFFLVVSAYCLFFSSLRLKVENSMHLLLESLFVVLRIVLVVIISIYLKKIISEFLNVEEDSHVWDIFYSKFTNYRNFHTLLYTCSEVFDFLPLVTVKKLFYSFLIPNVLFAIINLLIYWLTNAKNSYNKEMSEIEHQLKKDSVSDDDDSGIDTDRKKSDLNLIDRSIKSKLDKKMKRDNIVTFLSHLSIDPAIFYNVSQMVVYGVMAALVMRLKLLFVPQMCVVSALNFNKKYYRWSKSFSRYLPLFWVASSIPVVWQLIRNVTEEMSHIGEFSDIHLESLLTWISESSGNGASFAGSMPLMAAVMLVTRKPVVTHPHYEHKEARERAYNVYKVYGPFTAEHYYEQMSAMKVSHVIVEAKYCFARSRNGCSLREVWAAEGIDSANRSLCAMLWAGAAPHFYLLYRDSHYAVFKLHDYSVRYMPRSFDT